MRKLLPTLACAALVVGAGLGARWMAAASWASVVGYRSPYIFHNAHPAGRPLARRVLLVVLDGVRLDTSRGMPFLNALRARGADGTARVGLPSLSNPGRAVMATGAWQEVNGVTNNNTYAPVTADSIFSLAHGAGLKTAIAGGDFWHRNFGSLATERFRRFRDPHQVDVQTLIQWQRSLCDGLEKFVRASQAQFIVADLTAEDPAAHDFGPLSQEAREVLGEVDNCLKQLASAVDLRDTVVLVTADHGHVARGGHGGEEPTVMNVPLVIAGGPAQPGVRLRAQQTDIAPTICALLGLPFPSTNQGRVLVEALEVSPAALQDITERQQKQLAEFQELSARVQGGTRDAARDMAIVSRTFHATAALLLLLLLASWILLRVCRTPAERSAALTGLAVFYLVYFTLFSFGGLGYSLSAVNREEYLARFFSKDLLFAGAALLVAAFAAGFVLRERRHGADSARLAAALSAVVSLSLLVQVVLIYWFNGLQMSLWMMDLHWGFKAYLDLLAMYALAFALWATPVAFGLAQRLRAGSADRSA